MLGFRLFLSATVAAVVDTAAAPTGDAAPTSAPLLFEITLQREWDGGLFGFVLEQAAEGQLVAELTPGMRADVDDTLLQGDIILGAEGRAEGLHDEAVLHECRDLDTIPPGTELISLQHRGLYTSYRAVRLVVQRTPPFVDAEASALVPGPLGEWQPVQLRMRYEYGSHDLTVSSEEGGEVQRVVRGRLVIMSRIQAVGTLVELTVVTAAPVGLPVDTSSLVQNNRRTKLHKARETWRASERPRSRKPTVVPQHTSAAAGCSR